MSTGMMIFFALVFGAVFLMAQAIVVPTFGDDAKTRKQLRKRLAAIDADGQDEAASLLRDKYLRELPPFARWLESLPGMESLARMIEQSGNTFPAYGLIIVSALVMVCGAFLAWLPTHMLIVSFAGAVAGAALPFIKVSRDRKQRFEKIEEQLPDAIDIMRRALRAGHPFGSSLRLVAEDMDQPIAKEFELTFSDINYGNDLRRAMLGLLSRVPSITMMALVTAVLVQKETGGNLAEILEQIAKVVRSRFRFYRRVRTLSAEGRMSAWILLLVPFVLFGVLTITSPEYLPVLVHDERGQKLLLVGGVMATLGILWIRKIINVKV